MVHLSGTIKTSAGITYDPLFRFSPRDGEDGQDAPGIPADVQEARFMFVADTANQTVIARRDSAGDPWNRGYADIQDFTGGVTGLATQDSTGITIPNAGIYSFSIQLDVEIRANENIVTTPPAIRLPSESEWGVLLHIENADGNRIDDFTFFVESYSGVFASNATYPVYGSMPPLELPANSKVYIRLFYINLTTGGGDLTSSMAYRITTPVEDDDRIVIRRYTVTSSGTGSGGSGNSIDIVYRRSSSTLTSPPVGGTALNGELRSAPSGWSTSIPSGTDPIYTAIAHIHGGTNSIRYDEPVQWTGSVGPAGPQGPQGIQGPQGNPGTNGNDGAVGPRGPIGISVQEVYRNSQNTLLTAPSGGTAVNGQLTAAPSGWSLTYPGLGAIVWKAVAVINGNTIESWSRPQRITGDRGPQGVASMSTTFFFQRTASSTAPPRPTSLIYNGSSFGGLGSWVPGGAATGTDRYLWILPVQYTIGVNRSERIGSPFRFGGIDGATGPQGPTGPQGNPGTTGPTGPAGGNGFGYQYYYHANTANTVTAPHITYDGSAFSAQSGWTTLIPTAPAGANVFLSPVRYQVGNTSITIEGVVRFGTVPGSVAPQGNTRTYSNGITYGLANDSNNPVGTALQSNAFTLAVGASHTTEILNLPQTTVTADNWYITLPAGLSLTAIQDTVQGAVLDEWTRVGSTQTWIYTVGFEDAQNDMTFTVRRDN